MNHSLHFVYDNDPEAVDPDSLYAGEPYSSFVKAIAWLVALAAGWGMVTLGYLLIRYLVVHL